MNAIEASRIIQQYINDRKTILWICNQIPDYTPDRETYFVLEKHESREWAVRKYSIYYSNEVTTGEGGYLSVLSIDEEEPARQRYYDHLFDILK